MCCGGESLTSTCTVAAQILAGAHLRFDLGLGVFAAPPQLGDGGAVVLRAQLQLALCGNETRFERGDLGACGVEQRVGLIEIRIR